MGRVPRTLLALVCAALLGGCGSGDEGTIPSGDAEGLISLLDAIEDDLASGDCELAQDHAADFVAGVNELPNEVDNDVKGALTESAARMAELSGDPTQCEQGATGEDGAEDTSPSTTTDETTTTTTTDDETTDDETDEPPADEGDDGGGGETGAGSDDEPAGGGGDDEAAGDEPEVEVGPTESGGIDPERRTP